jgi:hypothetical protein
MEPFTTISKEEIKSLLIEVHLENLMLWGKWFNQASDPVDKSGLYRYREGFDAAILNIAQRLQISLANPPASQETQTKAKKAEVIALKEFFFSTEFETLFCPHCHQTLFRKKNKFWYCPTCKINFRFPEKD